MRRKVINHTTRPLSNYHADNAFSQLKSDTKQQVKPDDNNGTKGFWAEPQNCLPLLSKNTKEL